MKVFCIKSFCVDEVIIFEKNKVYSIMKDPLSDIFPKTLCILSDNISYLESYVRFEPKTFNKEDIIYPRFSFFEDYFLLLSIHRENMIDDILN